MGTVDSGFEGEVTSSFSFVQARELLLTVRRAEGTVLFGEIRPLLINLSSLVEKGFMEGVGIALPVANSGDSWRHGWVNNSMRFMISSGFYSCSVHATRYR